MSSLNLTFRHPGEEAIVRKALVEAYGKVLEQVEVLRRNTTDTAGLLALAGICDHARERRDRLHKGYERVCQQIAADEADDAGEVSV